jgi:hypothetical protein
MSKPRPLTLTLKWDLLERIANYYEFPVAAFLTPKLLPKNTTRVKELMKLVEKYRRIEEIVEEK